MENVNALLEAFDGETITKSCWLVLVQLCPTESVMLDGETVIPVTFTVVSGGGGGGCVLHHAGDVTVTFTVANIPEFVADVAETVVTPTPVAVTSPEGLTLATRVSEVYQMSACDAVTGITEGVN